MGKLKNTGLIGLGVVAGVAVSLQFSAMAQKTVEPPLPLEELRQLADVFGLIKSDYVEPVEDKKLLEDAISGMVASLDPQWFCLRLRTQAFFYPRAQSHLDWRFFLPSR